MMDELPDRFELEVKEVVRNETDVSPVVRRVLRTVEEHVREALRGFIFAGPPELEVLRGIVDDFLRKRMTDPRFRLECADNKVDIVPEDDATRHALQEMIEGETCEPEETVKGK